MPSELEELVEFLHHGNIQIRQIAAENLVGYSTAQPSIFKTGQLTPVKDLKHLVKDYAPIAKNALTMLINISDDPKVLENVAGDDAFLESLLVRITNPKEPNANEIAMLLANLAKSDAMKRILDLKRDVPKPLSTSPMAMDQLVDCFVKGAEGRYNPHADFDYLAYFFADLAKYPSARTYFTTPQPYDTIIPLTKLIVFTEHASPIRRKGVASTIKNVAFDVPSHPLFLDPSAINLLPYILLPIMGAEEFSEDETMAMLPDLQLLPPDKKRDGDVQNLRTHLETLLLLTTTRGGREKLREAGVYPVVRELHRAVGDEGVGELVDRLVQMLMRDEAPEGGGEGGDGDLDGNEVDDGVGKIGEDGEEDEIVEIF